MCHPSTTVLAFIKWKVPQPRRPLSTSLDMYCLGPPWHRLGASPGHRICTSVVIDTLRDAHEGAPPWVPNCIPLSRSPQHLYGAIEQDDPLTFGHAIAPAGIVHI